MKKFLLITLLMIFTMGASANQPPPKDNRSEKEKELDSLLKQKQTELTIKKIQREIDKENEKYLSKSEYTHSPISNGIIKISDRMIEMPIMITGKGANDIAKKISYYNRKNNYPIFLVMDVCYGGSVLGGEKIMRSIKTSKAKVYIVVKTFAASMAAIISSTFAEQTYFLKHAIILHHEVSIEVSGNTSQHSSNMQALNRWQEILFKPIAERRGQTVPEFIQSLYAIKRDGDATLMAEDAVKEKWILNTIEGIEDESFNEAPSFAKKPVLQIMLEEDDSAVDRISPGDFWHVYKKIKMIEAR